MTIWHSGLCAKHLAQSVKLFSNLSCHLAGLQQAPAIGRAIMELILDDSFQTIDLTRFGYDRIINDEVVKERNIV